VWEVVDVVDAFVLVSCGTEVQEVNKQLPTRIRSAEMRSFFISNALGVETLRA
jgi:Zn ribbon nucleic-acid-binding protein